MLTHEEWKKQLQEVDKRYVEYNKPNKPIFFDKPNLGYNNIEESKITEKTVGGLQYEVENIIKDLAWARIDVNGAPYIDNIPQAAQAVISHIFQLYRDDNIKALLEEMAEFLGSCQEVHNSRDYYQQFDEIMHYDLVKKIDGMLENDSCDICGDYHDKDSVPLSCETGDGE